MKFNPQLFIDSAFQNLCDKFVDQNIICLANHYVELAGKEDENFYCDLPNLESWGEQEWTYDEWQEKINEAIDQEEDTQELEELEPTQVEIFQWFRVNNWLAEKLLAKGQVVADLQDGMFWGRQTCGQSTSLDRVITDLVIELDFCQVHEITDKYKGE